jgi:hypothetical protein
LHKQKDRLTSFWSSQNQAINSSSKELHAVHMLLSSLDKLVEKMKEQIQSQEEILSQAIQRAEGEEETGEIQAGLWHLIRY